ncbi:MAG TPA: DUF1772 domain-containing protein [Acidobacteriaceae bacterium]|nr:DUF1772 domain-containing protein [Acidobacteriaceae bacterium]
MTSFLGIATTLCIGLMIGTEFAVSAFINPVLEKLDNRTRVGIIRLFAAKLGFAMPFWYCLGLLLLVAEAIIFRHGPQLPLLISAAGLWAAIIVLTLLFLVPINNRMMRLSPDTASGDDLREHKKWDSMHRIRVIALTGAMTLFLIAIHV